MKTPFDSHLAEAFRGWNSGNNLLLTPNLRLARFLKDAYARLHPQIAFESLQAHAINSWLLQLWEQLDWLIPEKNLPQVLTTFQESLLWDEILDADPDTPPLINKRATAKQAQDAWQLMHQWKLDIHQCQQFARAAGDSFIFRNWCSAFQQKCRQLNVISQAELVAELIQALKQSNQQLNLPIRIQLYGFDEISPIFQDFFACLQSSGCEIHNLDWLSTPANVARAEFTDPETEIKSIAAWANQQLQQNPDQTIGIVIPDLTASRSRVERLFMEVFEPQYILLDQAQHATGFNITAGQKLSQLPMIQTALRLLNSYRDDLPLDHYSQILLSPFVGRQDELLLRAECDKALRKLHEMELPFYKFKRVISEVYSQEKKNQLIETTNPDEIIVSAEDKNEPANFYQAITQLDWVRKRDSQRQLYPSEWLVIFNEQLAIWQWPGDRPLDSLEYQQWQSWQSNLEIFAGLDSVVNKISQSRAKQLLEQLLNESAFHAETRRSPIQILGLLEAAGLPFDQLWIAGLTDQNWPGKPKPNSLLPIRLQVELGLPQSSAEREYAYAQALTQRLLTSGPKVFASHALQDADQHFSPSQLIAKWPVIDLPELDNSNLYINLIHQTTQASDQSASHLESLLDFCGPSIHQFDTIRGGTQILKSQAACPFQSFARYRLQAEAIDTPSLGLDAMQRGNLLHSIMDILWQQLRDQQQLLALSDEQLINLIQAAAAESLKDIRHKKIAGARFVSMEVERLSQQVFQWMQLEKQRTPFKVLLHESRKTIKLEKLPIHIRYDRVDELDDGSLVVLDYKTGLSSIQDWQGDRPNEPQVPLYAIANSKKVSAAAFAIINNDSIGFAGIADREFIAPGIEAAENLQRSELPADWQSILQHWEKVLHQLAREFVAGSAAVDPKHPANTCRYCELQSLCRIREQFDFDKESAAQDTQDDVTGVMA